MEARVRQFVNEGQFGFYVHCLTEAKKDGIAPEDMVHVILTGKVVEEYADRNRLLFAGNTLDGLPLHVVCDYSAPNYVFIVTSYIPDREHWQGFRRQRRKHT